MSQNIEQTANRAIIVYDGVCHLCNGSLNFVLRHQRANNAFYFVPFQSDQGRYICEHFSISPNDLSTFLYVSNGGVATRSDAWLRIMAQLAVPYNVFARLTRIIPGRIRDYVYDAIGERRYRWFGQSDSCLIPGNNQLETVPDLEIVKSLIALNSKI